MRDEYAVDDVGLDHRTRRAWPVMRGIAHVQTITSSALLRGVCDSVALSPALSCVREAADAAAHPAGEGGADGGGGPIDADEAPPDESSSLMAKLTGTESKPLTRHIDAVGSGLTRTGMCRVASSCTFKPLIFGGFG